MRWPRACPKCSEYSGRTFGRAEFPSTSAPRVCNHRDIDDIEGSSDPKPLESGPKPPSSGLDWFGRISDRRCVEDALDRLGNKVCHPATRKVGHLHTRGEHNSPVTNLGVRPSYTGLSVRKLAGKLLDRVGACRRRRTFVKNQCSALSRPLLPRPQPTRRRGRHTHIMHLRQAGRTSSLLRPE